MFGMSLVSGILTHSLHGALIGAISFGTPVLALALLAGAVFSFIYIPGIGRLIGVALVALSVGAFGYDKGFENRAELDKSAIYEAQVEQLKANAAEVERQIVAANAVAADAKTAQQNAEDHAAQLQEQVDMYVAKLARLPAPGCDLTDGDVVGLRGIGPDAGPVDPPKPAKRPGHIWPTHKRPGTA